MGYFPIRNSTFIHSAPATTWTIQHTAPGVPVVDVYCEVDGIIQKIIPVSVVAVSPGICEITFSVPRSGTAVISG